MKQLRQYIRQVLLTEAAFTVDDLPDDLFIRIRDDGEMFDVTMVKKYDGYTSDGSGYLAANQAWGGIKGDIQAYKISNSGSGNCLDAYMVSWAGASDGWGPLLYDIAIEFATQKGSGLIADRESVSEEAEAVWRHYMTRRSGEVPSFQMDDLDNSLTPQEDDNCDQEIAKDYAMARDEGLDGWKDSPLSKLYKKSPAVTIEKLKSLGKLVEV